MNKSLHVCATMLTVFAMSSSCDQDSKHTESNLATIEIPTFDGLGYDKLVLSSESLADTIEIDAQSSSASLPVGYHLLTIDAMKDGEIVASNSFAPCLPTSANIRPVVTNRVPAKICTKAGNPFESTPADDETSNTQLDIEVVETHSFMLLTEMSCDNGYDSFDLSQMSSEAHVHSKTGAGERSWINHDGTWNVSEGSYDMDLVETSSTVATANIYIKTDGDKIESIFFTTAVAASLDPKDMENPVRLGGEYTVDQCRFLFRENAE